jgi:hypothetical protein
VRARNQDPRVCTNAGIRGSSNGRRRAGCAGIRMVQGTVDPNGVTKNLQVQEHFYVATSARELVKLSMIDQMPGPPCHNCEHPSSVGRFKRRLTYELKTIHCAVLWTIAYLNPGLMHFTDADKTLRAHQLRSTPSLVRNPRYGASGRNVQSSPARSSSSTPLRRVTRRKNSTNLASSSGWESCWHDVQCCSLVREQLSACVRSS